MYKLASHAAAINILALGKQYMVRTVPTSLPTLNDLSPMVFVEIGSMSQGQKAGK